MELWVRSQDRMTLCKCNNIYIDDEWVSPYYIKNGTLTLGKYKTKERALEVLDEIQNILKPQQLLIVRKDFDNEAKIELLGARQSGITQMEKSKLDFYQYSTYVYEMPKD